ncbi:hypothetical protein C8J57DRAFT_1264716 [Mycena rebaudengoi]|nr:hypothetical protein C8J57DRAFT_1264716 [Mycena rebaudengoi]
MSFSLPATILVVRRTCRTSPLHIHPPLSLNPDVPGPYDPRASEQISHHLPPMTTRLPHAHAITAAPVHACARHLSRSPRRPPQNRSAGHMASSEGVRGDGHICKRRRPNTCTHAAMLVRDTSG